MSTTPTKTDKPVNPYRLRIDGATLSYPHLFKPQKAQDSEQLKFSGAFILGKESHANDIKKLQALIKKMLDEKNKGKRIAPDRVFLRDGTAKPDTEGYTDDVMFFNAGNTSKPVIVGKNPKNALTEADDLMYPGAKVNVVITLWFQDNKHGQRINASLEAVQFSAHGTRIGAAPVDPEDVFDRQEGADEEDEEDPMA